MEVFIFRFSTQSKFQDAENLLYEGALQLFKRNQISSGTDLSKLYIEVLEKRSLRTDTELEDAFQRVADLFKNVPKDSPDYDAYKAQALRWAASQQYPSGHPRLHQLLAYNLWSFKRFVVTFLARF